MARPTFVYVLRAVRPAMLIDGMTRAEEEAVTRHVVYLQEHAERGDMLLFGRTDTNDEGTFGLVVFEADSQRDARALMERDPAVEGGVMRAELRRYRVAYMRG